MGQAENIQALLNELARPGMNEIQRRALQQELARNQQNPNLDAAPVVVGNPDKPRMSYAQARNASVAAGEMTGTVSQLARQEAPKPLVQSAPQAMVATHGGPSSADPTPGTVRTASVGNGVNMEQANPPAPAANAPARGGIDIGAQLTQLMEQNSQLRDRLANTSAEQKSALETLAAANETQAGVKSSMELGKMEARQRALTAYGVGLPTEDAYGKYTKTQADRIAIAEKIAANEAISPISDPLNWLGGQINNMLLVNQHNSLAAVENASAQAITQRQQFASNALALDKGLTTAQLEAADAADKEVRKASLHADLNKITSSEIKDRIAGNNQSITSLGTLRSIQNQEDAGKRADHRISMAEQEARARELRQEQNLRQSPQELARTAMLNEQLAQLQAKQENDQRLADTSTLLTGIPVDKASMARQERHPNRPLLQQVVDTGKFGNDVDTSFEVVKRLGVSRTNAGSQKVRNAAAVVEHYSEQANNAAPPPDPVTKMPKAFKSGKEEEQFRSEALKQSLAKDYAQAANDANHATFSSPFIVREGQVLTLPEMQNNSVAKLLKEQAKISTAWNTNETIQVVKEAVAAGALNPDVAARDLASFFRAGQANQMEMSGLNMLGIAPLQTYKVTQVFETSGTSMLGGQKFQAPVDLFNPVQIKQALDGYLIYKKTKDMPAIPFMRDPSVTVLGTRTGK